MLLLMSGVIVTQRWHTFDEPMDRDISGYAVIGHEMLHGRCLYSDLWERKPPLLFAVFAASESVTGYGPREIFLLNVLAALGTLVAVYAAGGVFAAMLWTLFCGDMWLLGNQPNAEAFVNLCMAGGFTVLVRLPGVHHRRRAVVLGALFAAATLFKHHVVVMCAGILLADFFVSGDEQKSRSFQSRMLDGLIAAGVMVIAYMLSAWIVVALPGHFWAHYYQLMLPPLCIGGGWCAAAILQSKGRLPMLVRVGLMSMLLMFAICWEGASYRLNADAWAREKYATDDLPAEQSLGLELGRLLKPDERFWEWGDDNVLYFASRKSPPSGLLYLQPITSGPEQGVYADRMMKALTRSSPDLVMIDQRWAAALPANIMQWLSEQYVPYRGDLNRLTYRVMLRRGSDIARRLGQN